MNGINGIWAGGSCCDNFIGTMTDDVDYFNDVATQLMNGNKEINVQFPTEIESKYHLFR